MSLLGHAPLWNDVLHPLQAQRRGVVLWRTTTRERRANPRLCSSVYKSKAPTGRRFTFASTEHFVELEESFKKPRDHIRRAVTNQFVRAEAVNLVAVQA